MLYDFKNCNVIIVDVNHMINGLGSGTPISIDYNSDLVTPYTGAKGETSHAKTNDLSATLTITLQHTSPSNAILQSMVGKEFSISIVDSNAEGAIKATPTKCMILKIPENARGSEITEREWTVSIPRLEYQ